MVAVSGGVDSMALLHMLQHKAAREAGWKLVVAHLDHGIRQDTAEDRRLVQAVAEQYGLPFVYKTIALGVGASEAEARRARYDFLHQVRHSSGARALMTAHHQDDVLETAIINLLRGTGRKGLTSLSTHHDLIRPLLAVPKSALIAYALENDLRWREDTTNQNPDYLRNYVRQRLLPRFAAADRQQLQTIIEQLRRVNHELDTALTSQLHLQNIGGQIDRRWFNQLPHTAAREVLAAWLRAHGLRDFDRKTLERLVVAAKVAPAGQFFPIRGGRNLQVQTRNLALTMPER